MLRETNRMEEAGFSVEDVPESLPAKRIRIVHDGLTVKGNVVPRLVLALAALLAKCMHRL
jgi:hypothetical protein